MTTWRDAEQYLDSLWLLDREDDRPLDFHGAFIPAVAEGLILRHTQPGQWIWDPMAGRGTTGRVAERLGRRCFMSDLTPTADDIHLGDARGMGLFTQAVMIDGAVHHLRPVEIGNFSDTRFRFDLVILHPPYHSIVKFSDKRNDLSNCTSVEDFLDQWDLVISNTAHHLKPKGYLAIVIGDIWITRKMAERTGDPYGYCPLGFRVMNQAMCTMTNYGYDPTLKAIVVKDIKNNQARAGQRNLWSARYFKWGAVHFAHEYIFSIQMGG